MYEDLLHLDKSVDKSYCKIMSPGSYSVITAFYELRGEESCSGIGVEDRTVDILCSLTLPEDKCTNKSMARIHWFFSSTTARFAISDGEKFGKSFTEK